MHKRKIAKVPASHQSEGIKWLILDFDDVDTGGFFLYSHRSLGEASEYDSWHETEAAARAESERLWGVKADDWFEE